MKHRSFQLQTKRNHEMSKFSTDVHCKSDCKSKLRQACDEIFRLKNELNERKLDVKGKSDEVTRLRSKCVTLETTQSEVARNCESAIRGQKFDKIKTGLKKI